MRHSTDAIEHDGELNTLPYLDVLMNLIIFMLLSMTGLATYGVINTTVSGSAPGGAAVESVRVSIHDGGFSVLRGDHLTEIAGRDYSRLAATLEQMKTGGDDTRATLAATPETPYEIVTATLDAMRGSAGRRLFTDVALDRP